MTIGQLAAIRARIAGRLEPHTDVTEIAMAVADLRSLLDEVDRLHIERDAAFRRGAEKMREAAAQACEVSPIHGQKTTTARRYADAIRALPIPEDKS
jgi:hypothetical protein